MDRNNEKFRILLLSVDYEWISNANFKFNGKYFARRDPFGNIINPKFRQYSLFKSGLVFFLLAPAYFFEKLAVLVKKIIK